MDHYTSFPEFLKGLKSRPRKVGQTRVENKKMRLTKRDQLRDSKRTYSPMPPTPFKTQTASTIAELDEQKTQTNTKSSVRRAAASVQKSQMKPEAVPEKAVQDRMNRLKKWRDERDKKRAAEKANKKPAFRASRFVEIPPVSSLEHPLGNKNHKFKAPANIKPISFQHGVKKESVVKSKPKVESNAKKIEEKAPKANGMSVKLTSKTGKLKIESKVQSTRRNLRFQFEDESVPVPAPAAITKQPTAKALNANKAEKRAKTKIELEGKRITRQASSAIENKTNKGTLTALNSNKKVVKTIATSMADDKVTKTRSKQLKRQKNMDVVEEVENLNSNKENIGNEAEINPKKETRFAKTPVKTPRTRKSLRALAESSVPNDGSENIDAWIVDEALSPMKSEKSLNKTPIKTPKATRGRKSAGRTPGRRLTKKDSQDSSEYLENDARINVLDENVIDAPMDEFSKSTDSCSIAYPCESLDSTFTLDESPSPDDKHKTPENNGDAPLVYVSPFVTMSRGKKCARSEYKLRVSKGGECVTSPETTGTKAGSAYFYKLLDDEIARIRVQCDQWEEYKLVENPPEEACNMINVPVGQSNLLISKKMQQFRALIDKSVQSTDNLSVTCADLHGFWDTVMIQVTNLDKRFNNLIKLRDNQWKEVLSAPEEELSTDEPKPKRQMPKRGVKKPTAPKPVSKIRDAIKAARANKNKLLAPLSEGGAEFNGGFFNIKSPKKTPERSSPRKTPRRENGMSLLKTVLYSANRKSMRSSPGLAMIKATQHARMSDVGVGAVRFDTPTKSILKLSTPKSAVKKAVIFKENEAEILSFEPMPHELHDEEEELVVEEEPVVKTTPRKFKSDEYVPPRRSLRLSLTYSK